MNELPSSECVSREERCVCREEWRVGVRRGSEGCVLRRGSRRTGRPTCVFPADAVMGVLRESLRILSVFERVWKITPNHAAEALR